MGGPIAALTKELYVIANLLAGGGKAAARWTEFSADVEHTSRILRTDFTRYPGHAIELARQAVTRSVRRIHIFGGDGTLNEVLNGIIREDRLLDPDIELVFLSAGSSCDVEKLFPARKSLTERIDSEIRYRVDVGKLICHNRYGETVERYFLANSSIGVISQAIDYFNRSTPLMSFLKRFSIDAAVIYAGLENVFRFGNFSTEIILDQQDRIERELKNITIFKCPFFGGGMNYGIETAHDDGWLHVALINRLGQLRTLAYIPALYMGTVLRKKQAEYIRAKRIRLHSHESNIAVEADGEIIGHPPCEYSILPQLVNIIC